MYTTSFSSLRSIFTFAEKEKGIKFSPLKEISLWLRALEVMVLGETKLSATVDGLVFENKNIHFIKPKTIDIYLSRRYLYLQDEKLNILVYKDREEFRKDSQKTLNSLFVEYIDYYEFLYNEYVINEDQDPLTKDAQEKANLILEEFKSGSFKN